MIDFLVIISDFNNFLIVNGKCKVDIDVSEFDNRIIKKNIFFVNNDE